MSFPEKRLFVLGPGSNAHTSLPEQEGNSHGKLLWRLMSPAGSTNLPREQSMFLLLSASPPEDVCVGF